jgi:hypothetical protein
MIVLHRVDYNKTIRPKDHLFDLTFRIYDEDREYYGLNADPIKELATWCYQSFKHNFILLESCQYCVAGGYADNAMGLKDINAGFERKEDQRMTNYYELRCSKFDAIILLLKYKEE